MVKDRLDLGKISILNKYLEPEKNTEGLKYDLISVRGVSNLTKLAAIAGPRLKPGAWLLAFKGPRATEELDEAAQVLKKWRLKLEQRIDFDLPLADAKRCLLRLIKF